MLTPTTTSACAKCKKQGYRKPDGRISRYDGQRYGVDGKICDTCRSRFRRAEEAEAAGRQPHVWGRPSLESLGLAQAGAQPGPRVVPVTVAEIKAATAEIRRDKAMPRDPRFRPYEDLRPGFAAKATAERSLAFALRHPN